MPEYKMPEFPERMLLRAVWGGRKDPLNDQAEMVWQCWQRLAAHGGFLANAWRDLRVNRFIPLSSLDVLNESMTRSYERGCDYMYHFTQRTYYGNSTTPTLYMSVSLSSPEGGKVMVANQMVMQLDAGLTMDGTVQAPLPVDWLLGIGAELVADMVQAWHPDAVSLDCGDLVGTPNSPGFTYPTIGFVSWLSDSVVDPGLLPDAPVKRRFGEGTILGIDPGSSDPLADALALADRVYSAGILSMVPFVQGQPNPDQ